MEEHDKRTRRLTLLTVAGGNFVQLGCRLLIGAIVPFLLLHFETSRSAIGMALTGMWAIYAFAQFPSGILADRYGERLIILVALLATGGGVLLVASSTTVLVFGVFVLVFGAGAGLFFAPASALTARVYVTEGRALGILTASGALAGVVFPALGGLIGELYGWRAALLSGGVIVFIVVLVAIATVPSLQPSNPTRSLHSIGAISKHRQLLMRPGIAFSIVVGVLMGFTFQAITSFFPTFLVEYRELGTGAAGVTFGFVFGLSAIAQPIAGHLSDRISRDFAIGSSALLALAGLLVLLGVQTTIGLIVGVSLLGIGISWPGPVQARFFDYLDDDERGYGFGLVRMVYMFLAASGSVVVGSLADIGGWLFGLGSLVVVLLCSFLLIVLNSYYRFDT